LEWISGIRYQHVRIQLHRGFQHLDRVTIFFLLVIDDSQIQISSGKSWVASDDETVFSLCGLQIIRLLRLRCALKMAYRPVVKLLCKRWW
jgi:hypothetical protein